MSVKCFQLTVSKLTILNCALNCVSFTQNVVDNFHKFDIKLGDNNFCAGFTKEKDGF